MFWFTLVKSYKMGYLICQIARRKPNYVRKQAFENPSTVDIKTLVISTILFYISRVSSIILFLCVLLRVCCVACVSCCVWVVLLVGCVACVLCCVCVVLLVCCVAYVL